MARLSARRPDQIRDKDAIRRHCIVAEIDDLDVVTSRTAWGAKIWVSLQEPGQAAESAKFQFKMTRKAAKKLSRALDRELRRRQR